MRTLAHQPQTFRLWDPFTSSRRVGCGASTGPGWGPGGLYPPRELNPASPLPRLSPGCAGVGGWGGWRPGQGGSLGEGLHPGLPGTSSWALGPRVPSLPASLCQPSTGPASDFAEAWCLLPHPRFHFSPPSQASAWQISLLVVLTSFASHAASPRPSSALKIKTHPPEVRTGS